jgi:hypothetical protein
MKTLILSATLLTSLHLSANEVDRSTVLTCSYAGGVARETQNIRQSEHDDWATFESKVRKIYKDDEGLHNLLVIARTVYDFAPKDADSDDIFDSVFDRCLDNTVTQQVKHEYSL